MGLTQPFTRLANLIGVAVLTTATACGSASDLDVASNAAEGTAAAPAFVEMQKADIIRSTMGCLQSPPYPLDGGPICLRGDGSWISYSGWGNSAGRFRIVGNKVFLHGPPDAVIKSHPLSLAFFRDRKGTMFISDEPLNVDRPLRRLTPYSEAKYLSSLTRSFPREAPRLF